MCGLLTVPAALTFESVDAALVTEDLHEFLERYLESAGVIGSRPLGL